MRIKQTKNPGWSQEKYGESSILGLQFKDSVTMSLVPGVLHRVSRRVEARPLLYAAKGNFDFFSPGAELILAILRLSDMMVPNLRL